MLPHGVCYKQGKQTTVSINWMTLFRHPAVNTGQEFIKKSLSVVILARDRILAQSYYPLGFPFPLGERRREGRDFIRCVDVFKGAFRGQRAGCSHGQLRLLISQYFASLASALFLEFDF